MVTIKKLIMHILKYSGLLFAVLDRECVGDTQKEWVDMASWCGI
jgi:hypothetical protein